MSYSVSSSAQSVILHAPLTGPIVKLEQVPDPVFSQKMMGDGISIDPTDTHLVAPCDGKILHVHAAHHALTVETPCGLEVLMHIGLETVALKGAGFDMKVKEGDQVKLGDVLIEFDMDYVATHAKSLLTQIIITNGDNLDFEANEGHVKAGTDFLLKLTPKSGSHVVESADSEGFEEIISEDIFVINPSGFHARPAARLSSLAKKFQSKIEIQSELGRANSKSVVSIMKLDVQHGTKIQVVASGVDAQEAIKVLTDALKNGLGEEGCIPVSGDPVDTIEEKLLAKPRSQDPNILLGIGASAGLAIGQVLQLKKIELAVPEQGGSAADEQKLLQDNLAKALEQLSELEGVLLKSDDASKAEIFAAHRELLDDPDLLDFAQSAIYAGKSAAYAWKTAYNEQALSLAAMQNDLLAERANDIRDVGERVLRLILGLEEEIPVMPKNTILFAEDLTPSQTATLDPSRVLAFCTVQGGASSHVAILARAMGIPAIAGIEARALELVNGADVIVDGTHGRVELNATEEKIAQVGIALKAQAAKDKEDKANADKAAVTTDKHRVEIAANVTGLKETEKSVEFGGEGVGLLRSEILFQDRPSAPTEDEQADAYESMIKALGDGRFLIIRTLDVGGDKPLPYLPIPAEENPFLGERGIRVSLKHPETLRTQLRAILRASQSGDIRVMFPMITVMDDLRQAKAILEEERLKLGLEPIKIGIMVEVPTVALMADQFAQEVDFFSIGTNDLAQYTLAVDRGHPRLAPLADGLNPGVLQLIAKTVESAHKFNTEVGVCGALAGDPQAVPVLIGLGVDELSVSVPVIPAVKAQIRELNFADCAKLAQEALLQADAAAVRALVPLPEL